MRGAAAEAVSWASSPAVRRVMQGNSRKRDTSPELLVRHAAHRLGLRYRVAVKPLEGSGVADMVFPRSRVAVFVDGCFWHGCPEHFNPPRTNARYWQAKIARNRDRDQRTSEALRANGWCVVRVWEHERPDVAAERIAKAVASRPPLQRARYG